eukprot:symbB.v1.2.000360.t1/scaffold10.1/size534768/13
MSQQKDEAERYRSMDSERKKLQAEFTLFRVCCAETKAQELLVGFSRCPILRGLVSWDGQEIAKSIQNLREEVDEVQVHQREADQQVEEAEKQRAQVQVAVSNAEKHLQSARSQLHQLSPDQLQARTELEVCERRQQEASKLQELEVERQKRLSEQEEELKSRVQQLEEELQMLKSQSHEMPFSEQQWQQFRSAQEEADRLTSYQSQEAKELEQQIKAKEKQKAMAEMDRREAALRVRHLKQKVESLESCLSVKQKTRASYQSDVQQLTKELQGLAEGQQRWSSAKKKLEDERKVIIEEIQNITATEQQIERERRLTEICQDLGQVVPGVAGRVVNLCQHVQKKYRVAVNVALGNYMDAVITDSIQHARQCVQHLKDRMMEPLTFLPLDNLRAAEGARLQEALRGHPALRPALNCISHDQRHQRAFDFMLSDVVIADSLDDGRRFVFEDLKDIGIKCRVVTLNGETISRDGNLAVSSEAKRGSTRFDFTELETAKQRLEAIEGELIDLQSKHSRENAVYAQVQDSLRQAELVFRDAEQELHRVESELEGRHQELSETEEQLATVPLEDAQQEGLKNQLLDLEQRIGVETRDLFHDLDVQLGQDVRKLERELRMKREAVQFQEDAILRQQTAFKAELAMVQQTREERRGRSVALEDEASTEVLKQRHQDLDQQLAALQENIDQEAEALKQQEELLKSQEQAVAAARRALKEKQREASEGERRLSVLGSELKEAREARLQLLCQSLLEDVDLPFVGSKKDCKAALRQIAAGGGPSSHELSVDVQLDYQQLPEEGKQRLGVAAAGGAASQLLEDEYRNELRRLGGELEQLQPNLKAFNQLDEADQEVMAAEREAQKARKKMEAVERTFEEVRSQRREKFMHCFQQVQDEIQEEELLTENEKLKEKLREKVWTMALATVSGMEKLAGGVSHAENVTLPNRIAALERAVFGESASSQDLERIAAVEVEYQQLQDDYLTLSEEFDKLKDQPPVVIEKEDKRATFLEEQLGRMQEQYQAMQLKLNKMRVEHLELQTAHQELRDSFAIVKAEAEKKEKELTTQLRVLREKHARVAQEMQLLGCDQCCIGVEVLACGSTTSSDTAQRGEAEALERLARAEGAGAKHRATAERL